MSDRAQRVTSQSPVPRLAMRGAALRLLRSVHETEVHDAAVHQLRVRVVGLFNTGGLSSSAARGQPLAEIGERLGALRLVVDLVPEPVVPAHGLVGRAPVAASSRVPAGSVSASAEPCCSSSGTSGARARSGSTSNWPNMREPERERRLAVVHQRVGLVGGDDGRILADLGDVDARRPQRRRDPAERAQQRDHRLRHGRRRPARARTGRARPARPGAPARRPARSARPCCARAGTPAAGVAGDDGAAERVEVGEEVGVASSARGGRRTARARAGRARRPPSRRGRRRRRRCRSARVLAQAVADQQDPLGVAGSQPCQNSSTSPAPTILPSARFGHSRARSSRRRTGGLRGRARRPGAGRPRRRARSTSAAGSHSCAVTDRPYSPAARSRNR